MLQRKLFVQFERGMIKFNHPVSFEVKVICVYPCCMAFNFDTYIYSPCLKHYRCF